jgi:hypothetical protein
MTASLGNVTVRGKKCGKSKRGARLSTVCLSMYSITENIYCSQLSSVAILLQPEPNCITSYNTRKWFCFLSLCAIVLQSSPPSHVSTCNGQRSSQLFWVQYTAVPLACQGTPSVLRDPEFYHRVRKIPPPVRIVSQMNSIHILQTYLLMLHFNIILPSKFRFF